jgi:hypothetical protein
MAARVPAAARRVKCPLAGAGIVRLPQIAQPRVSITTDPIPAGFRPVAVVECVRVPAIVPVTGLRIMEQRRVAVSGLGRLVTTLRMPSTRLLKGGVPACLAPISVLPWLVLIGADGQVIHPAVPVGPCGLPIVPVLTSLSSLHWIPLGTTTQVPAGHPPLHGGPVPVISPVITAPESGAPL